MRLAIALVIGLVAAALAFALRTRGLASMQGQGGDAWYYLLYVEEVRRSRRVPPALPYFLLDISEQWYPPGFPVFLSLLPWGLVTRYRWALAAGVDCVQLVILYGFTLLATQSLAAAVVAATVYASLPTLIAENLNLNSRSFGSLLFTLTMLSLFWLESNASPPAFLLAAACGAILWLSHKLSSQALAVILVCEAVITRRWSPVLALAAGLGMAFFLSGGFFLKVLKGHRDILCFWRRNLQNLGAHQVYDSPLYASRIPARPSQRFHAPGIMGFGRHAKILLSHNPYVLALPLLTLGWTNAPLQGFCLRWLLLVYLWALATTFVPPLRFLGEGVKYLKLAAFPLAFLLGAWAQGWRGLLLVPAFAIALSIALGRIRQSEWGKVDDGLAKVAEHLRRADSGGVMAIPAHVADAIAYLARREVMWGAHSAGYERLEPFFPVLRRPIQAFFEDHDLRFLVIDRDYVRPEDLELQPFQMVLGEGSYQLYRYLGSRPAPGERAEALYMAPPSEMGRER